jgi:hypothetical protein
VCGSFAMMEKLCGDLTVEYSETSESHLKSINRLNNIVTFLTSFMAAADKCPRRVVIAAGQCLNTLTDDNKDIFIEFQNHPEYIDMLVSIVKNVTDEDYMLVRILACGKIFFAIGECL